MIFDIYGPFDLTLPTQEYERWRAAFWRSTKYRPEIIDGLKLAVGCYAFCLTYGKISRPWYVGKTTARIGFAGEVFQPHKLAHYREIKKTHRGRTSLVLFPLIRETGDFSFAYESSHGAVNWLERTLIGMALARNPGLRNARDTKMLRNVWVRGLLGERPSGRPHAETDFARHAFLTRP